MSDETVPLACDCGQEYEIRDDTPDWAAPWIMCPRCYLSDGVKFYSSDLT